MRNSNTNEFTLKLENAVGSAKAAYTVLGVKHGVYYHWCSGIRPLPEYIKHAIEDKLLLSPETLSALVRKRLKEKRIAC